MPTLFFPRRYPPLLRVAVFVVLSVLIAAYSQKNPRLQGWAGTLSYPVLWINTQIVHIWQDTENYLQDRNALLREDEKLHRELQDLQPRLLEGEILRNENRQLLALLDSIPRPPGRVKVAEVISQNLSPGSQLVTVNIGSQAGVFVGQPVLADGGVAGQVISVSAMSSQVALLSDLDSSVPAQIAGTNIPLLVNGKGNIHQLIVPFQARNTALKQGDRLVTSGLGGRYPPGLNIGTISAVIHNGDEPFAQILVRPAVRLGQLNTVLVLWKETADPQERKP
ncbi:MAG: rod shape-determining protein MreC [Acidithiobacillus sp.]